MTLHISNLNHDSRKELGYGLLCSLITLTLNWSLRYSAPDFWQEKYGLIATSPREVEQFLLKVLNNTLNIYEKLTCWLRDIHNI